jgi:hypothetical protein
VQQSLFHQLELQSPPKAFLCPARSASASPSTRKLFTGAKALPCTFAQLSSPAGLPPSCSSSSNQRLGPVAAGLPAAERSPPPPPPRWDLFWQKRSHFIYRKSISPGYLKLSPGAAPLRPGRSSIYYAWYLVVSGGLSCEFGFVGLGFRWVQVADFRSLVVLDSLYEAPKNEAPTRWLGEVGTRQLCS